MEFEAEAGIMRTQKENSANLLDTQMVALRRADSAGMEGDQGPDQIPRNSERRN